SATVTINVVNGAPVANADSYTVHGTANLNLLQNDSDPDGDPIIFDGVGNGPFHGVLVGNSGQYEYRTNQGYVGSDSFNYTIHDSLGASATGTVTINVVNQAPIANPDLYVVYGSPWLLSPLLNDTDPEGDPFVLDGLAIAPQHGVLVDVHPGQYSYRPNTGYVGTDTFSYSIRDSLFAYSTGTVTLYVIGDGENNGN